MCILRHGVAFLKSHGQKEKNPIGMEPRWNRIYSTLGWNTPPPYLDVVVLFKFCRGKSFSKFEKHRKEFLWQINHATIEKQDHRGGIEGQMSNFCNQEVLR